MQAEIASSAGPEQDSAVWCAPGLLTERQRNRAAAAAFLVCGRLREPDHMRSAARLTAEQKTYGRRSGRVGWGLADGWAGIAVLFEHADRCRPREGWQDDARAALGRVADAVAANSGAVPPGLASGWAGIAFASTFLARDGQRYGRWRRELVPFLERAAFAQAESVTHGGDSWPFAAFDHISGLAGMVAGLLPEAPVDAVAGALVTGTLRGVSGPLWPTAPGQIRDESLLAHYPGGLVNLGMAHGLAGVVAALALAVQAGVAGPDGEDALGAAAGWLADQVRWVAGKPVLPSFCPLGPGGGPVSPGRTAWCYGPPGAARTLALAGSALGRPELAELGTELLLASLDQPAELAWLNSPTFCHGLAGVLHIAARMAEASDDGRLAAAVPQLCDRLLDAFEPDSPLGFRSLDATGNPVDTPALLDGAAGAALVLLSLAHEPAPRWDRAFLLS
jgi:lantibiotic biosynthesis protein